jgi:hypothetical protein
MGTFEDNIRDKFNSAEVPMGTGDWGAFEHKLDGTQMSDLLFTQKAVNALEFSFMPYSPEHWKAMHDKLDLDVDGNFESKIRSKFSEANAVGSVVGWDEMLSKLDAVDAGGFEKSVKEKINKEEIEYEQKHWKAMEKMLDKDKRPALWAYVLIGVLALGVTAMWVVSENDSAKLAQTHVNSEVEKIEEVVSQPQMVEVSSDDLVEDPNQQSVSIPEIDKGVYEPSSELERKYLYGYSPTSGRSEREFITEQKKLVAESRRKRKHISSYYKKSNAVGGSVGGSAQGGTGGNHEPSNTNLLTANFKSSTSEEQLFAMAEMEEENVAFSEPYLDYQFTEVKYNKPIVKKSVLHVGLLPWLNFWDNAAATGLSGKNQVSLFSSQDWKVYRRYGNQVDFEFNQPLQILGGYEHGFQNSGFAVGTYLRNKWQNNWVCSMVNLSGSYEKELSGSVLRFGAGVSYKRNQLLTEGLTLIDQVSETASSFNERELDEFKVPAETYLMSNFGVMVANKHFMFAYNMTDPIIIRLNYNNEKLVTHTGIASGTVSLSNAVKVSTMVKVTKVESTYFTPAVSLTKENSWFLLAEFEDLNRYIYTVGYQFSKFRTYASYGHVTRKEVESSITDLFSQSGHIAVGLIYTRQ